MSEPKLRVLSLGAGVQSSTMALMAAHGEFEHVPDCAIFADTGWEPKAVYEHLQWLMSPNVLPFPVHVVQRSNLREDCLKNVRGELNGGKRSTIPAFVSGKQGAAPLRRQCTRDYKLEPLITKSRRLLGVEKGQRVPKGYWIEKWVGISTDEAARMKPDSEAWSVARWPLIEKGMSRNDCLRWLERSGYPLPAKSSCIGCPYHNDRLWREIKLTDPESWADAVDFDRQIRSGFMGSNGPAFLHRSLQPLDEVDLSNLEDHGQLNLFVNECEGMCGV